MNPKIRKPKQSGDYNLAICMLASGSKGNAIYISDGATTLLVDAGLSGVEIERRLQAHDLDPRVIDAMIVSHEHSDHIRGVGILSRRYDLPVYCRRRPAAKRVGSSVKSNRCVHSIAESRSTSTP